MSSSNNENPATLFEKNLAKAKYFYGILDSLYGTFQDYKSKSITQDKKEDLFSIAKLKEYYVKCKELQTLLKQLDTQAATLTASSSKDSRSSTLIEQYHTFIQGCNETYLNYIASDFAQKWDELQRLSPKSKPKSVQETKPRVEIPRFSSFRGSPKNSSPSHEIITFEDDGTEEEVENIYIPSQ